MKFKNINLFKPNSKEISSALDIKNPTVKNLEVIGKKFMKKNLIDNLMITLSEKGILIITKQSVSNLKSMNLKLLMYLVRVMLLFL